MDQSHRLLLWFTGILAGCLALAAVLPRLCAVEPTQVARENLRNLSSAGLIEIRDPSKRSVMRGEFRDIATQPGDRLRTAQFVSSDDRGVGKAEIELTRHPNGLLVQEIEIDVDGLASHALFVVFVDGVEMGTFRTDAYGGAELERYGRVADISARAGD